MLRACRGSVMDNRWAEDLIVTGLKHTTALLVVGLCAAACASSASPRRVTTPSRPEVSANSRGSSAVAIRPAVLRIGRAAWELPGALSREVVFSVGGSLEVAGGLRPDGTTSGTVTVIDPRTGRSRPIGSLAVATHDAAGASLGGHSFLFGGGVGASEATVQRLTSDGSRVLTASLPHARSDLVAARVGAAVYLLGGYDGTAWAAQVLRTTDGSHFATVTRLPVPVRYPAIAVEGRMIWVFGGQAQAGPTSVVQRIDVDRGRADVVGRMPHPLADASAVVLGGRILLCGGSVAGRATATVQRFDPHTLQFTDVGRLLQPLQDAGSAVIDGVAYLLGGEAPRTTRLVETLRLVTGPVAETRS